MLRLVLEKIRLRELTVAMMPDLRSMAEALADELQSLETEKHRLEQLLDLDQNWRELRQLDAQIADSGSVDAADSQTDRRATLIAGLASNRVYAARLRLMEAIEILAGRSPEPSIPGDKERTPATVESTTSLPPVNEIITLDQPDGSRIKVRVKSKRRPAASELPSQQAAPAADGPNEGDDLFRGRRAAVSVPEPGKATSTTGAGTLMSRLRRYSEDSASQTLVPASPPKSQDVTPPPPSDSGDMQRPPAEAAPDVPPDLTPSAQLDGEIEEATVVIIPRAPRRNAVAAKPQPASPPAESRTPSRRRSKSSRRKSKSSRRKPADKENST